MYLSVIILHYGMFLCDMLCNRLIVSVVHCQYVVFEIILELIMQEDAEKVCGGDKFSR